MTELVGIISLGVFVGLLLGLGLAHSKPTAQVVLTLLGAALGGAPIAFMSSAARKWFYPVGLLVGLLSARLVARWIDVSSVGFKQKGSLEPKNTTTYQVFYPKPFENAPYLKVAPLGYANFEIVEQRPDGFDINFKSFTSGIKLEWVATGVRKNRRD